MKLLDHQNVIAFFGCNTIFMPTLIVLEYAQFGDLEKYLVNKIGMVRIYIIKNHITFLLFTIA